MPEEGAVLGKTRPPYPAEFRREALSILRSGARTPAELLDHCGISARHIVEAATALVQ